MTETSAGDAQLHDSSTQILSQNLWLKILIGMILGVALGALLSPNMTGLLEEDLAFTLGEWFALPGIIFLGLITMVIVPLIVCSIIVGIIDSGKMETVRDMGLRLVPYFILTTAVSITIGLTLVHFINPGQIMNQSEALQTIERDAAENRLPQKTFEDLSIPARIANMIPTNPAKANVERNMLQLVIAAIITGLALLAIQPATRKPLADLCVTGQVLSMKIISWAMVIAPVAVFGLLTNITIHTGLEAMLSLGLYMVTVMTGLLCMYGVYLIIVCLVSKRSIRAFIKDIRDVQLLAFSTSSSAATMPFSMEAAEQKLGVRRDISRFVIPLGATINMDGTALYQAVAAVFLCQVFGIELTLPETIMLLLTTIGASIGTPATPGVGIIVLATILTGIGVPPEGIGLIIGVDRILDMCRTTINVTGDLTATTVMQKLMAQNTSS